MGKIGQKSIKSQLKIDHESIENNLKIDQKLDQTSIKNQSKIDLKSIRNRPKINQNRSLEGVWADSGSQVRLGRLLERFLCDLAANIGPTWDPRWHQVGPQIVEKSMSKSIKKLKPLGIHF